MYQGLRLERHVEGRGRVVAEVDFSCGEHVLLEEPFAYALSAADNAHTTHCHSSLLSADLVQLQRCSGCKFAYYSSVSEQRRAWPRHRLECGRIARALRHGQTPSSLLLLVGRILDCQVAPPNINTKGTWNDLEDLELKYGKLSDDHMTFLTQVAFAVRDYMGASPAPARSSGEAYIHVPHPPPAGSVSQKRGTVNERQSSVAGAVDVGVVKEQCDGGAGAGEGGGARDTDGVAVSMRTVFSVLLRLHLNAFTIVDDDLRPVGTGLYLLAAHLRHSCEPNCLVSFDAANLQVYAAREIRRGEVLVIIFIPLLICPHTATSGRILLLMCPQTGADDQLLRPRASLLATPRNTAGALPLQLLLTYADEC